MSQIKELKKEPENFDDIVKKYLRDHEPTTETKTSAEMQKMMNTAKDETLRRSGSDRVEVEDRTVRTNPADNDTITAVQQIKDALTETQQKVDLAFSKAHNQTKAGS